MQYPVPSCWGTAIPASITKECHWKNRPPKAILENTDGKFSEIIQAHRWVQGNFPPVSHLFLHFVPRSNHESPGPNPASDESEFSMQVLKNLIVTDYWHAIVK